VKSRSATRTKNSSPVLAQSATEMAGQPRKSAVYHPCDLISLKNHCTPWACSAEPSSFRMFADFSGGFAGVTCVQHEEFVTVQLIADLFDRRP